MPRGSHYAKSKPTKAHNRAVVQSILVMRPSLSGLSAEGLARSYGLPVGEIDTMLRKEAERRKGAA